MTRTSSGRMRRTPFPFSTRYTRARGFHTSAGSSIFSRLIPPHTKRPWRSHLWVGTECGTVQQYRSRKACDITPAKNTHTHTHTHTALLSTAATGKPARCETAPPRNTERETLRAKHSAQKKKKKTRGTERARAVTQAGGPSLQKEDRQADTPAKREHHSKRGTQHPHSRHHAAPTRTSAQSLSTPFVFRCSGSTPTEPPIPHGPPYLPSLSLVPGSCSYSSVVPRAAADTRLPVQGL